MRQRKHGEDTSSGVSSYLKKENNNTEEAKKLSEEVDNFLDQDLEREQVRQASMCCGCRCQ